MKIILNIIKKVFCVIGTILAIILTATGAMICFSIQWMFDTWSNLTMDELIFHLTAPLEGTNEEMIGEYFSVCVAPTVVILLVVLVLFCAWKGKKRYYVIVCAGMIVSLSMAGVTVRSAWNKLDVEVYVEDQKTVSDFIEANYVNPADVELIFPEKKRNLIYIFLESMETTYADKENGGAFEKNVIPELTKLSQENENFSGESEELNGGYAMTGATWTVAGMFAQTSGLPLSLSIEDNSMDTQESFFSGAIVLGDILEEAGYSQTLMIGSDAIFGGRKLYFTEHGNYNIEDYNYAIETGMLPADYRAWWGYEDQKLFGFAKEKLLELASNEEPFNLTLLTADTHFEDGYLCELCPDTFGDDLYSNVMLCSSGQVNEFVEWIQQQDFYENTTIVLMGDHPTMDSNFCSDIDNEYERKVYTAFINPAVKTETSTRRIYNTFDSFPTTLAALGVQIEGNRLGLGTNLFSSVQTLTERYGFETEQRELRRKSEFMENLADLDENSEALLRREGKLPTAAVWCDNYQYDKETIPVGVAEIKNVPGTESVQLAVWTNEDQSDFQWIQMEEIEEGRYYADIYIPNFYYKSGEYYIQAYVVDGSGEQYMVGETVGIMP